MRHRMMQEGRSKQGSDDMALVDRGDAACASTAQRLRLPPRLQIIRLLCILLLVQLVTFHPAFQSHRFFAEAAASNNHTQLDDPSFVSSIFNYLDNLLPRFSGQQNVRTTASSNHATPSETVEGLLFNWGPRRNTASLANPSVAEATSRLYDAIIVGGGAVGCPLARTLADAGKEVLLIERGGAREDHPQTLDIYGAGVVIDNKEVSQPVLTTDGVISHIGNVLSGGSAINMAIVIQEIDDYFDYLESFPGVSFDRSKFQEAFDWTLSWLAHPMPESLPYGERWRLGLDQVFGPHLPYRTKLSIGNNWAGSSAFDSDNNWFRVAADVALGQPGVDFPSTLHVLLNHNVHTIDFELDPATGNHRATCVQFARTTADDTAPIGRMNPNLFGGPLPSLLGIFQRKISPSFSAFIPSGPKFRACVKPGGEIISSAGALLTPLLMYKSGVGPREVVDTVGVPLVKEVPEMGRGLRDRVFMPIGLFFKDPMPDTGHPPRICQSIGLAKAGPNCENFSIGERSLSCTLTTAEELSGARIGEGTIYATRYILPPQIRNAPIIETMFQILRDCGDSRSPLNNPLLRGLCTMIQPIIGCFRRVAANLYFTSEPKSLAEIEITRRGEFMVSGNYLKDPQDLQDAMRGVANIIRVINSDVYDGIFQPAGLNSCPATILNGLVNLAGSISMNLQDVSGMSADDKVAATKELGIDEVQAFLQGALNEYENEANKIEEWRKREEDFTNSTAEFFEEDEDELEGAWLSLFGTPSARPRRYWTSQRYATYPPTIPEPTDSEGLKKFAKSFMTSMWHWVGSAQMGVVVDNRFLVNGFSNLRIVDASVLNQVTRMNPFFTLTAMGRYAGAVINEDVIPPPPDQ